MFTWAVFKSFRSIYFNEHLWVSVHVKTEYFSDFTQANRTSEKIPFSQTFSWMLGLYI